MAKLPEIPSEFIEPYLAKFMGSMIEFISSACITQEELDIDLMINVLEAMQTELN